MKTYAQAQGKKPFNWNKFLNKKKITTTEWCDASELAAHWATCACGNQCAIIPRDPEIGNPLDRKLENLGSEFMVAVDMENKLGAKTILEKIEKRACKIINRMLKELKHAKANC